MPYKMVILMWWCFVLPSWGLFSDGFWGFWQGFGGKGGRMLPGIQAVNYIVELNARIAVLVAHYWLAIVVWSTCIGWKTTPPNRLKSGKEYIKKYHHNLARTPVVAKLLQKFTCFFSLI